MLFSYSAGYDGGSRTLYQFVTCLVLHIIGSGKMSGFHVLLYCGCDRETLVARKNILFPLYSIICTSNLQCRLDAARTSTAARHNG